MAKELTSQSQHMMLVRQISYCSTFLSCAQRNIVYLKQSYIFSKAAVGYLLVYKLMQHFINILCSFRHFSNSESYLTMYLWNI